MYTIDRNCEQENSSLSNLPTRCRRRSFRVKPETRLCYQTLLHGIGGQTQIRTTCLRRWPYELTSSWVATCIGTWFIPLFRGRYRETFSLQIHKNYSTPVVFTPERTSLGFFFPAVTARVCGFYVRVRG